MLTMTAHEDFAHSTPQELNDHWEVAMADHYLPAQVRLNRSDLVSTPGFLRRFELQDLAILELHSGPATVHSAGSETADEELALIIVERGYEWVSSGNQQRRFAAGDVVLWDSRHPVSFNIEHHALKRNLLIPRAELRAATGQDIDLTAAALGGPCLTVLNSMIRSFVEPPAQMSLIEGRSLRNAAIELVAGAIRNGVGVPDSAREQLRNSIELWIEQNLSRKLTPPYVAAEHAISVRTLNRLFSERGETLGGYVRERRLERAYTDVISTDLPLTSIAHRWHFSDGSHFTRLFKSRFGASPTSLRRSSEPVTSA